MVLSSAAVPTGTGMKASFVSGPIFVKFACAQSPMCSIAASPVATAFSAGSHPVSTALSPSYSLTRSRNLKKLSQCGRSLKVFLPLFNASTVPSASRLLSMIKCVASCPRTHFSFPGKEIGCTPLLFNVLQISPNSSTELGSSLIPALSKTSLL